MGQRPKLRGSIWRESSREPSSRNKFHFHGEAFYGSHAGAVFRRIFGILESTLWRKDSALALFKWDVEPPRLTQASILTNVPLAPQVPATWKEGTKANSVDATIDCI